MFYHLLESSHPHNSNKWSNIRCYGETTKVISSEAKIMHLIWSSVDHTDLTTKIEELREYLPTYEDLTGSVNALLRLQDTYRLDTADIALGNVGGVQSQKLSGRV